MSRIQIKLCGFRCVEDVQKVKTFPIDAIGFILVPGRKRTVREEEYPELLAAVPSSVKKVGVFLNPTQSEMEKWFKIAPLDIVQLHGTESPEFCKWVRDTFHVQIIKTFHIHSHEWVDPITAYQSSIDVALLDHAHGGTGQTYDWSVIPPYQKRCQDLHIPLWVAGGLTSENVFSLLQQVHPNGIDVSSGIESDGVKDFNKIKTFIERVTEYEHICP
jgi:phosphoribosylanthranilate isomerase